MEANSREKAKEVYERLTREQSGVRPDLVIGPF